jgi:hypothetical protein
VLYSQLAHDFSFIKLEFIDYSDPNYQVDQGDVDELYPDDENDIPDEELIEEMREERRRKNDEYQFETYYKEILKGGGKFKGEWTVYRTSTFLPDPLQHDEDSFPSLIQDDQILYVVSLAKKIPILAHLEGIGPVPLTAIIHKETLATDKDYLEQVGGEYSTDNEVSMLSEDTSAASAEGHVIHNRYWPEELFASDFRGPNGIMCVGNAYTICHAVPLMDNEITGDELVGPFANLYIEVGMTYKRMRYRMKLEYRVKECDKDSLQVNSLPSPPLHLKTLTVCREALERWPRHNKDNVGNGMDEVNVDDASTGYLFGLLGAPGGLYDPPPIGTEKQASQYMLIDLEGCASALFPYMIDQDPLAHGGDATWVTSLDWTPGRFRYQVDRKFLGGINIRGLKTLELSEVEADQADQWRPRDGGLDMRQ